MNLSSVMKSCTVLLHPAWDMDHPFVQRVPAFSHLVALSVIRWTVAVSQCLCSSHPFLT